MQYLRALDSVRIKQHQMHAVLHGTHIPHLLVEGDRFRPFGDGEAGTMPASLKLILSWFFETRNCMHRIKTKKNTLPSDSVPPISRLGSSASSHFCHLSQTLKAPRSSPPVSGQDTPSSRPPSLPLLPSFGETGFAQPPLRQPPYHPLQLLRALKPSPTPMWRSSATNSAPQPGLTERLRCRSGSHALPPPKPHQPPRSPSFPAAAVPSSHHDRDSSFLVWDRERRAGCRR